MKMYSVLSAIVILVPLIAVAQWNSNPSTNTTLVDLKGEHLLPFIGYDCTPGVYLLKMETTKKTRY